MPSPTPSSRHRWPLATLRRQFWRFLFVSVAPLNLAFLRVAVFAMLLWCLLAEPIREVAGQPQESFQWPSIAGPVLEQLPISVEIVDWLLPVAVVATALAIVGLFTRTAAWTSVLLSTYLLGIAQCSGDANNPLHHVVLVGLLMACSRSGDALSIDSLWQALRRADRGQVERINHSVRYGLPIRLAMLVLAFTYFFPGLWALVSPGSSFASFAVALVMLWMVLWPLMLFWRPTRLIWAAMGLVLHNTMSIWSGITSYTMQAMYVMFVDWQRVFAWLGGTMFGQPIAVLYDGNCKMCRRTMSLLLALDWLKQLQPVNAFDRERFTAMGLGHLEDDALMRDMHAGERTRDREWHITKGFDAYQRIAWRVPLLWPSLLVIYLPPVAALGRRIYRHVADTRACSVPIKRGDSPSAAIRWSSLPLVAVAVAIFSLQVVAGVGRMHHGWPVACYPLIGEVAPDGSATTLDDVALRNRFNESRFVVVPAEPVGSDVKKPQEKQ